MTSNVKVVESDSVGAFEIEMVKYEVLWNKLQSNLFKAIIEKKRSVRLLRVLRLQCLVCDRTPSRVFPLLVPKKRTVHAQYRRELLEISGKQWA